MPELPEVETVRRGLSLVLPGRTITSVEVRSARAVRRQSEGIDVFGDLVTGGRVVAVARRGKYLWWELSGAARPVLVAHLGMSGQFRSAAANHGGFGAHERVRFALDDGAAVCFVDQRTFGWLLADTAAAEVPDSVAHIARDPFDPAFDPIATSTRLRARRSEVKRALLDQTVVSGIGNIYADETLWRMRLHPRRRANTLSRGTVVGLLDTARAVMAEALLAGGTSFDPLYVNVNGESGWFARDLSVYGREGQPCGRCGHAIRRERFMNRSSYLCPRCQRPPVRLPEIGRLP